MGPREHFDAVVVGSGFGGSVAAYRLAEAGLDVCVLERGRTYPPGSFARRPREMAANVWDPSRGLHGLFDLWSFRGIDALVASGLGGGSLIYANVLLRKDERWFVHDDRVGDGYEHWPVSRADLDPHYDRVERMMGVQRLPLEAPGFPRPAKTLAMRDAAGRLGLEWGLAPLAVTFANEGRPPVPGEAIPEGDYPNLHGVARHTCRLCGECDLGCNDGAKNTLDHTYLSAAKHRGAQLRTRCEVRRLDPLPDGRYLVGYVEHTPERHGQRTRLDRLPVTTVTADRVVVAAGTLGSTGLLLRNRAAFPRLSPALGTRFCGNGDLLSFVLNCRQPGRRRAPMRVVDASHGPVITSYVRSPDRVDGGQGRGFYVEDAGYPLFVDWLTEASQAPSNARRAMAVAWHLALARVTGNPRSALSAELADLLGRAALSSSSLPLLGMGRDVPDGVMRLRRGHLDVDWTVATSRSYFSRMRDTMAALARELGGEIHDSPLWWLKRVITVHPLGGCPMGRNPDEGVVDQWGEVFGYPGLHVLDGAAMPGPVGANPSLTIAAFADRAAEHLLEARPARRARPVATAPPDPAPAPASAPANGDGPAPARGRPARLSFTEEMKGFVGLGETDFRRGFEQGRDGGGSFMFHLTITAPDVDRFLAEPAHRGDAEGWVDCDLLGGRLPLTAGTFNLFVAGDEPGLTHMRYRLHFADGSGHPLTMTGVKDVRDDAGFDVWSDTTTLYTRVLRGHVAEGEDEGAEVVASGILRILVADFARQLTTFRVDGGAGPIDRARALADFGRSFIGELWEAFGGRAQAQAEQR